MTEIVITTAKFRQGQATAAAELRKFGELVPNEALLSRLHPEFAAGYRYEVREYASQHTAA